MKPRLVSCCFLNTSLYLVRRSIIALISTSLKVVSMAVVFFASTNLLLIVLRRLLIFSGLSSLLNIGWPILLPGFDKASSTSCFNIFPLDPLGVIFFISTFLSAKMAAATGVALMSDVRCSMFDVEISFSFDCSPFLDSAFFPSAFCSVFFSAGFSGRGAKSSIRQATSPIFNVSPSLATVVKIPACCALISNVAFSLSSSAITSSLST